MEWLTLSQAGFKQAARYLLGMRLTIAGIELASLAIAETLVTLSHRPEAILLCLLYGVLAVSGWLWLTRRPPAVPWPVTLSLLLDLVLIGGWLFFTGGYTNPLTSLLLLPLAVAIILVPLAQAVLLTICGVLTYTVLVIWHTPIAHAHDHAASNLAQLHLVGMWVTFTITASILLLVVGTLARRFRQQQIQLADVRERRLRDEQIIALGLSAAAVAHRLGTPLNTMTLLVDELRHSRNQAELASDLDLLEQQLDVCTSHLHQLSSAASQARAAELEVLELASWIARLRESATLLWPGAPIQWRLPAPAGRVAVDATLDQAVLNLLANALTASPSWVAVAARNEGNGLIELVVEDHGDGLASTLQDQPGEHTVPSENGLGVGLFLSNATIQRLGGSLKARVGEQGTTMIIELPEANHEPKSALAAD